MEVEERALAWPEVASFREVGACGTATVCVPIGSITDGDTKHEFGKFEMLQQLRDTLQGIQYGEEEDIFGWMREVAV